MTDKPTETTALITMVRIFGPMGEYGETEAYKVGENDVTQINAVQKEGQMSYIPYIQVWKNDVLFAEFCQHNILGVYYDR